MIINNKEKLDNVITVTLKTYFEVVKRKKGKVNIRRLI